MNKTALQHDISEARKAGYKYAEVAFQGGGQHVLALDVFEDVQDDVMLSPSDTVTYLKEYYTSPSKSLPDFPDQPKEVQLFATFMKDLVNSFDKDSDSVMIVPESIVPDTLAQMARALDNRGRELYTTVLDEEERNESYLYSATQTARVMFTLIRDNIDSDFANNLYQTVVKKNIAYGNSFDANVDKWGFVGATIRISDKVNRLNSLMEDKNTNLVEDESVMDTIMDIVGYSLLIIRYYTVK